MKFAVDGDLVCGLASASPPKAFVGELGDDAAEAAAAIVATLAGPPPGGAPVVTIAGQRVATRMAKATELAGTGQVALPSTWTSGVRVDGTPTLVDQGRFLCTPTGSLQSLALRQGIAAVSPLLGMPTGGTGDDTADDAFDPDDTGVASRTDYTPATKREQIRARCSSARLHDLVDPSHAVLVGDPVNVASGSVVLEATDFEHPDLAFVRRYDSRRGDRGGPLGPGWSHNFDVVLWLEPGRVVVRNEQGRELEFDCLELREGVARAGDTVYELAGRMRLVCHGHHHWDLHDGDRVLQFSPIPGTGAADTDRGMAKLRSIVVPGSPLVELDYDARARLVDVRSGGKAVIGLRYDHDDRIIRLCGDAARYEYDEAGALLAVVDASGAKREYEYDGGLLVRHTNRRGGSFYYAYDGRGSGAKCTRTWGDGGRLHRALSYEPGATVVTDSHGHRWTYGRTTEGLVKSMVDPLGGTHDYKWDDTLALARIDYPDRTHAIDTRGEDGRLAKQRERNGASWAMRYDDRGRLVEGTDPTGGTWSFGYDSRDRLVRVSDALEHVTRLEYEEGRLRRIIDPLGHVVELELSDDGLIQRLATSSGALMGFGYDTAGRLVRAGTPQQETRWTWDAAGRLSSIVRGHHAVRLLRDHEGALVGKEGIDEHGEVRWELRRDPAGSIVAIGDGTRRWGYVRDTEGRVTMVSVDGRTRWEARRDALGRVEAWVADGRAEGHAIRNGHRIERITHDDESHALQWDFAGRLVRVEGPHGALEYEYRDDGLLMGYGSGPRKTSVERDANGVVVMQRHEAPGRDPVTIESSSVDHLGNRYGLTVDDSASISHLWRPDGELDRIAVCADGTAHDLGLEPVTGLTLADGDEGDACEMRDALHRPTAAGDAAIVWDEDRVVKIGDALVVSDPRTNEPLAKVEAGTVAAPPPCPVVPPGPTDTLYAACFPQPWFALEDDDASPLGVLRRRFARRVWDPAVRPFAGEHPWDPDQWRPAIAEPEVPSGRLDQRTLMRLLSPFPRDPLALP